MNENNLGQGRKAKVENKAKVISRQVGLWTSLHVPSEGQKFECNFLVKQDLYGRIFNAISSNVFVNDTYNDLTL